MKQRILFLTFIRPKSSLWPREVLSMMTRTQISSSIVDSGIHILLQRTTLAILAHRTCVHCMGLTTMQAFLSNSMVRTVCSCTLTFGSWSMTGTVVGVYGSTFVNNPQTDPDPNLECFIDGVSIGREPIFNGGENNWKLCGKGGFGAGPHKLDINITVQSPTQTFWLDQIRYIPSPSVSLVNKTIRLTNQDPAIRLNDSWWTAAQFNATKQMNATAQVDFIGEQFLTLDVPETLCLLCRLQARQSPGLVIFQ